MANKKYHLTPDGPKICKASFRMCPYASHFGTEESAFAAEKILNEHNAQLDHVEQLKAFVQNPDNRYFIRSPFLFDDNSKSARQLGDELDRRFKEHGFEPQLFHSMGTFRLQNGVANPVEVSVMRVDGVDEENAKIVGNWRVSTKMNMTGVPGQDSTTNVMLDFNSEQSAKRSFAQVREIFYNGAVRSGLFNEEEKADELADQMQSKFQKMFNAIEGNAAGDFELWERGYGYFQGSDGETIVAREDYGTSAFRGENVRRFLAENHYYASYTPELDIRVSETNERNGTSWAVYKSGDQWHVEEGKADGTKNDYVCAEPQEVYNTVSWIISETVNPGDQEAAKKKGQYAGVLMFDCESALRKNREKVAAYWEAERVAKEARKNNSTNNDLYDRNSEEKGSLMGKIFDVFT